MYTSACIAASLEGIGIAINGIPIVWTTRSSKLTAFFSMPMLGPAIRGAVFLANGQFNTFKKGRADLVEQGHGLTHHFEY